MTSNINPNNIDGAYPVAGQDNNSQGFRTNFTNTSTNFQYAADEITALQNTAVLTANLSNSAPVVNNLQTSTLSNGYLQNMYQTTLALGPVTGSVTINYLLASYQTLTTNGPVSLAFSNFPAAGAAAAVTVQVTVSNTAHTLTFPSAVSINNKGIQGINDNVLQFAAPGVYSFTFITSDGGSTITVNQTNSVLQPFNATGENVSNGATLNAASSSKFTTTGAWTATLPAGVYGQVKELIMTGFGGNMVITVNNAGWKTSGSGTITFSAQGQGCTLRVATKSGSSTAYWWCVGNNGAVFA